MDQGVRSFIRIQGDSAPVNSLAAGKHRQDAQRAPRVTLLIMKYQNTKISASVYAEIRVTAARPREADTQPRIVHVKVQRIHHNGAKHRKRPPPEKMTHMRDSVADGLSILNRWTVALSKLHSSFSRQNNRPTPKMKRRLSTTSLPDEHITSATAGIGSLQIAHPNKRLKGGSNTLRSSSLSETVPKPLQIELCQPENDRVTMTPSFPSEHQGDHAKPRQSETDTEMGIECAPSETQGACKEGLVADDTENAVTGPPSYADADSRVYEPRPRRFALSSYDRGASYEFPWYSLEHMKLMRRQGLNFNQRDSLSELESESQKLCESFVESKNEETSDEKKANKDLESYFELWDRCRDHNAARVFRDITPLVVPSPEWLAFNELLGKQQSPGRMYEVLSERWYRCATLCGPTPHPYYAVGIAKTALTDDEQQTLDLYDTPTCPKRFTTDMYFPFLICEVSGSDDPLLPCKLRNLHSASMAANAIIQLYRQAGLEEDFNGKLLAISVCHDNDSAIIYGHFARLEEERFTFYALVIHSCALRPGVRDPKRIATYPVIKRVYELFFPLHFDRVKRAVAHLPSNTLPFAPPLRPDDVSALGPEENSISEQQSEEIGPDAQSSLD